MLQNILDGIQDPCERAIFAPYLKRSVTGLEDASCAELLAPACREAQLADLLHTLRAYAQDAIAQLVGTNLARKNALWSIAPQLAPTSEVAQAKREVTDDLRASNGALLDDAAPLLRTELERQTNRFVCATQEMCRRILDDRHVIANELLAGGIDGDLGRITKMVFDLADRHDGGRRTTVICCDAGRFVYKPHDCRIDVWFKEVVDKRLPDTLAQPKTLIRHDATGVWAFQEHKARLPVASEAGVRRYWHRMGRALALFQALGSEDLHAENFICVGEVPSLIDCEMVITSEPTLRGDPLTSPNMAFVSKGFGQDLRNTLVLSAVLPAPLWRPGVTGPTGNSSPLLAHGLSCLPVLDGKERSVLGYEDELLSGFDEGLRLLAGIANDLMSDVGMTAGIPVRRLIRDTQVYLRLLTRLRKADAYRPGVADDILHALHRPLVRGQGTTRSPLALSEAACLREGDVPYFYANADSLRILGSDGTADDRLLESSAIGHATAHIVALDEPHRTFLHAVTEANLRRAILPDDSRVPICEIPAMPLSTEAALAEAERVFGILGQLCVMSPSGEESWLFRGPHHGALDASTIEFSGGLGGMAVFLAALAPRTNDLSTRNRSLSLLDGCLARIDEAVSVLEEARVIPQDSIGSGLCSGLGGLVRSLDVTVRALAKSNSCGDAIARATTLLLRVLAILPKADMQNARSTDVYGGTAGLLLALAQCPLATDDERARDAASELVNDLLDKRTLVAKDGTLLWNTLGTSWPVSGMGHGQAGIAAALTTAHGAFGLDVGTAATDALAWELGAYSEKLGSWPDLREAPVSGKAMHGVCSGAPGMGLAALAVCNASATDEALSIAARILKRADKACLQLSPTYRDTLCCGNGSAAEYYISRGLTRDAGQLLAGMVNRSHELGHYVSLNPGIQLIDEPDLFNGLAGVGYELLRYVDPSLPGVFVG